MLSMEKAALLCSVRGHAWSRQSDGNADPRAQNRLTLLIDVIALLYCMLPRAVKRQ